MLTQRINDFLLFSIIFPLLACVAMVVVMRERIGHLDSHNTHSRQLNQLHETTQAACLLDYAKLEKTAEVLGNRQFNQFNDIKALNAELNTLSAIVNDVLLGATNRDEL